MIEVRLCRIDEIDKLQKFINDKWKANHVLSTSKKLLNWQHYNKDEDVLNFVVAYDTNTNDFLAILGFIPVWKFDEDLADYKDIWLSLWKTDESKSLQPGIGLSLLDFLYEKYSPNTVGVAGINEQVAIIYNWLEYTTGFLNQYYFINPGCEAFHIAVVPFASTANHIENQIQLKKVIDLKKVSVSPAYHNPRKSIKYLITRYQNHPVYKYEFYSIQNDTIINAILVIRKVTVDESSCLRIIDIFGDIKSVDNISVPLTELLIKENAEYIDCINYGIDETVFTNMGFSMLNDSVTIPNYFEPFERRNVSVRFAYLSHREGAYYLFKGDSDQDRPSILNKN